LRIVQTVGSRQVSRDVKYYNLQMIIAIGFKVNNEPAVQTGVGATGRSPLRWMDMVTVFGPAIQMTSWSTNSTASPMRKSGLWRGNNGIPSQFGQLTQQSNRKNQHHLFPIPIKNLLKFEFRKVIFL
jgi:hypothetical protein